MVAGVSQRMELPPIILLRAFDAAGRHGSFRRAAEFLNVTPSTISHQIADLEQWLGVQLFVRAARGLQLTNEGTLLLQDVAPAFERLRSATARLRSGGQPTTLRVSANPFFATEILLPLMADFDAAFPHLALHVSATETLEDPRDGAVDFCVRTRAADAPGLERVALFALEVAAVATTTAPLPRIDYPFQGHSVWSIWQQRGGPPLSGNGAVRHFSNFDAAQRAAARGLGVTLTLLPIAQPWLRANGLRIVDPFRVEFGMLELVSRELTPQQRTLRDVRDWLVAAFRAAVG